MDESVRASLKREPAEWIVWIVCLIIIALLAFASLVFTTGYNSLPRPPTDLTVEPTK